MMKVVGDAVPERHPLPPDAPSPSRGAIRPVHNRNASVLVVAEAPSHRETLSRMLRRAGYSVVVAADSEQTRCCLENTVTALVLLDAVKPSSGGLDVLQTIRSRYSDSELPVIMVTEETERESIINAFRMGANDYLTRPLDREITLARVSLHMRLSQAQTELHRSEERYAMAAQGSGIGIWDWDATRDELFVSDRCREMLGLSGESSPQSFDCWLDRVHPDDRTSLIQLLSDTSENRDGRLERELRILHGDGDFRWMRCCGVIQRDTGGRLRRLAGSVADVTEGKVRDVLTALPNRLLFDEQLARAIRSGTTVAGATAVLFLDLDNFKLVNDSLGHDAGDLLLCCVARRLESCLRSGDQVQRRYASWQVARHGGDEFTVLLQNLNCQHDAERVADRIIGVLSEPFLLGTHEVSIGVSIGISFNTPEHRLSADLIRESDIAMYHAKTSGRGQYKIFNPDMQTVATERLALESDLRQAVKCDQFYLMYQPIVRLSSAEVEGFEALCRWNHPRGETIGPDRFIPVIESLGLISGLGQIVLSNACEKIRSLNADLSGRKPISITINYSPDEFSQGFFLQRLLNTVAYHGINPHLLKVEVTESALMKNPEQIRVIIGELRRKGIRIGVDDFGTGYSSLACLHRLPLDLLKIDRSFVARMCDCHETREIVRTIIALARSLELDVVAEGVETAQQRDMLFEMGCSHAQGYFYARPMHGDHIREFLDSYDLEQQRYLPQVSVRQPSVVLSNRATTSAEICQRIETAESLVSALESAT